MPLIPYPNVPSGVFGVPIVTPPPVGYTRPDPPAVNKTTVEPNPAQTASTPKVPNVWQIVDDKGNAVITPDSVISFEYRNQQRVLNYPVENGAFASYNKVATPFDIRCIISCNGNGSVTREQFVKTLDDMVKSTNIYSFVTPDRTYQSINLVMVNYRREARRGVTLVMAECMFQEIRQTVEGTVTTSKPDGAVKTSTGQVSPVNPTTQQAAAKGVAQ